MPKRKKNPEVEDSEDEALALARGFHGRENLETLEIEETEFYRENLSNLATLLDLEVFIEARAKEGLITIPFEDVFIGGSPDRKQIYLVGETSLPDEWLEAANPSGYEKDKVIIGWVYRIGYWSDKFHLVGSNGNNDYDHEFGEQTFKPPARFKGVWKLNEKVNAGLLPLLIYDRLNERLELIGGGYQIRDEGIWD